MSKQVILTGIRANNDLHIGNYFGALLPFVDTVKGMSNEYQFNLFIPDLHSITTPIDHARLQENIIKTVSIYIASGIPMSQEGVYVYRQSRIPAHSEMTVILNNFTGMGEMSRMTQYKDKSAKLSDDRISVGLFDYPVLMASDILIYGANYVPVGDDQTQHLEFTRDIATRINKQFGDIFVIPKSVKDQHAFFQKDQGLRIKDLSDPLKKMSKSDASNKGIIFLSDSPEVASKKIMSATTDSLGVINYDPKTQPGVSNLMDILTLTSGVDKQQVIDKFQGQTSYGTLKAETAAAVSEFLTGFHAKLAETNIQDIINKLEKDEAQLKAQANETLLKLQHAVGLR